jgi:hypothetical protein
VEFVPKSVVSLASGSSSLLLLLLLLPAATVAQTSTTGCPPADSYAAAAKQLYQYSNRNCASIRWRLPLADVRVSGPNFLGWYQAMLMTLQGAAYWPPSLETMLDCSSQCWRQGAVAGVGGPGPEPSLQCRSCSGGWPAERLHSWPRGGQPLIWCDSCQWSSDGC